MTRIVIAGAGLAGLSCALVLSGYGHQVTILEKNTFPFHKVCGEYVSNEVLPFLSSLDIDVSTCGPSRLTRLKVTGPGGAVLECPLDLGGFGLSRYSFDGLLYKACLSRGIPFHTGTKVQDIRFDGNAFHINLPGRIIMQADLVIGAWGKRSNLDQKMNRPFFYRRSPFMAVKYHVRSDFPEDLVQLDLFPGGYSGICRIEAGQYSLCYLSRAENLRRYGSIREMEKEVLFTNPALRAHMEPAGYFSGAPHVINQISFESKPLTGGHVLFCGDAAGMISPLFGNGMAMAIRSGKFLAEVVDRHLRSDPRLHDRSGLEQRYEREWQRNFRYRIGGGRLVQRLFMQPFLAEAGIRALRAIPGAARLLIKNSHGRPF